MLSATSTVGEWIADPHGGPIVTTLLAEQGVDAAVLTPVLAIPLERLVSLTGGALSAEAVEGLVARVRAAEAAAGSE